MDDKIIKILDKMTDNLEKNYKLITKKLAVSTTISIDYFFNESLERKKVLLAIESLLKYGIKPDDEYGFGKKIIFYFLNKNLSEEFYCQILELAIKHGYNINFCNKTYESLLLHIFNENVDYYDNSIKNKTKFTKILPLYNLLVNNGYDIFVTDKNFNTIGDAILKYIKNNEVIDTEDFIIQYSKDRWC